VFVNIHGRIIGHFAEFAEFTDTSLEGNHPKDGRLKAFSISLSMEPSADIMLPRIRMLTSGKFLWRVSPLFPICRFSAETVRSSL
jgi:hypothetical protein